MARTTRTNHKASRFLAPCLALLLPLLVLIMLYGQVGAQDPPPPALTVLGVTDGVAKSVNIQLPAPSQSQVQLQVFSTLTNDVTAEIVPIRMVGPAGDVEPASILRGGKATIKAGRVSDIAIVFLSGSLTDEDAGTYTAHLALDMPGETVPTAETTVTLKILAENPAVAAKLKVLDDELLFPFTYGQDQGQIAFQLNVSEGEAKNVLINLQALKGTEELFEELLSGANAVGPNGALNVRVDGGTAMLGDIPEGDTGVILGLDLTTLDKAGIYEGNLLIAEDNLSDILSTPFKFLLREPSLKLINDELVFEIDPSDESASLDFEILAVGANAQDVEVILSGIKSGEEHVFPETLGIASQTLSTITEDLPIIVSFALEPTALPAPGSYAGTITVKAANLADNFTKTFTIVAPTQKLTVLPASLQIQRCYPDWSLFTDWKPFSLLLGCGEGEESIEVWAIEDNVVDDVVAQYGRASTISGRPLDLIIGHEVQVQPDGQDVKTIIVPLNGSHLSDEAISENNAVKLFIDAKNMSYPGYGAYSGAIYLDSPDLAESPKVDVTVNVHHVYFLPVLAIGFGVAVAYWLLKVRDPNNSRLIRIRNLELQKKLDGNAAIPDPVRTKIQAALDAATEYLNSGDVEKAKKHLDTADNAIKATVKAIELIAALDIKKDEPGLDAFTEAKNLLQDGKVAGATEQATKAKLQYDEGKILINELENQRKLMKNHQRLRQGRCKIDSLIDQTDLLLDEILKPKFNPESVKEQLEDIIKYFGIHLENCKDWNVISRLYGRAAAAALGGIAALTMVEDVDLALLESAEESAKEMNIDLNALRERIAPSFAVKQVTRRERPSVKETILFRIEELTGLWPDIYTLISGRVKWDILPEQENYEDGFLPSMEVVGHEMEAVFPAKGIFTIVAQIALPTTESSPAVVPYKVKIYDRLLELFNPQKIRAESRTKFSVVLVPKSPLVMLGSTPFKYKWTFTHKLEEEDGTDKSKPLIKYGEGPDCFHLFKKQGSYEVNVAVVDDNGNKVSGILGVVRTIAVLESALEVERRKYLRQQQWASFVAFFVAIIGGLIGIKAFAPTFGSLGDYALAFLWGMGVNASASGITPITNLISKLNPKQAPKK